MDCSPPDFSVHGISQARILEWVAISSFKRSSRRRIEPSLLHCWWILHHLSHQGSPRILEWVAMPPPVDLPNPGIEPESPALQADFLPAAQQGKPKSTGLGSVSLLQWIFPTQELNQGLLHCRWIVYQLSYQGSLNHFALHLELSQHC